MGYSVQIWIHHNFLRIGEVNLFHQHFFDIDELLCLYVYSSHTCKVFISIYSHSIAQFLHLYKLRDRNTTVSSHATVLPQHVENHIIQSFDSPDVPGHTQIHEMFLTLNCC